MRGLWCNLGRMIKVSVDIKWMKLFQDICKLRCDTVGECAWYSRPYSYDLHMRNGPEVIQDTVELFVLKEKRVSS